MCYKERMTGLLTLSEGICCKKEVLGKSYKSSIAGIPVIITFPSYPLEYKVEESSNYLIPPEVGKTWKRGEKLLRWGYPMRHPSGDSCVELISVSTECEYNEETAKKIYKDAGRWGKSFTNHLIVDTKQNISRDKNKYDSQCTIEMVKPKYINDDSTLHLYLTFPKSECFASCTQIERAIKFADSSKELLLEYQMLITSYNARKNNNNRMAIIDACSSLELCLVENARIIIDKAGFDTSIFLDDKFRSLGDRLKLIDSIDKSIPRMDWKNDIVKTRNAVVHNRDFFPSDKATDTLIEMVEKYLLHYNGNQYY